MKASEIFKKENQKLREKRKAKKERQRNNNVRLLGD